MFDVQIGFINNVNCGIALISPSKINLLLLIFQKLITIINYSLHLLIEVHIFLDEQVEYFAIAFRFFSFYSNTIFSLTFSFLISNRL